MLKIVSVKIDEIYIPTARRGELDQSKVDAVTEKLLNGEDPKPIKVRNGKGRYVLVEGMNRLEANRALGESDIGAYIVQAPKF
ncbi:ParB N-terminal domain-containing protein [Kordiimonas lacus]|uniref:ParB-like nuclease domain-containing protein n=1 Tax=Kordiimonas lacus TaxID=637679 RepID=A0A1G7CCI8_9PROT|nr:ParB N-terminal domain-containing protein [Kordiimonas lacus]SDE37029.1 ParB-like nuclease domain-containing protein [Kordiimonas lacus]